MTRLWDYLPAPGFGRPYLKKAAEAVWWATPPEIRHKLGAASELVRMLAPGSGIVEASNEAPKIAEQVRSGDYGAAAAGAATGILGSLLDFAPAWKLAMAVPPMLRGKGVLGGLGIGPKEPSVPGGVRVDDSAHITGTPKTVAGQASVDEFPEVVSGFTPDEVRRVTKFAEKFGQRAIFEKGTLNTILPVGNWEQFIHSPEFHGRLDEMHGRGLDYMRQQHTPVWWDGPAFERIYGGKAPVFTDLLAASSPNTMLVPNVQDASEYMRRLLRGEPLAQPNARMANGLMTRAPGTQMRLENNRMPNLHRVERGAYQDLQREKVAHEARALRGDPNAAPIDRHIMRASEVPARGIYAVSNPANFFGKPYQQLYDQLVVAAQRHDRTVRDFAADLFVGIREHVRKNAELFGTKLRPSSVRGESKSYNDLFEDLLEQKAHFLGIDKREFERRLSGGDASLLSGLLATPGVAALLSQVWAVSPASPREPEL